ncbi:UDP-N-acetylmuramoyl-tripeptide--D-alanyl-D-alanine ligase [Flavobacteriaceae bacterium S356]|uniref:UDP-N-acetylmuramoyl-tripeptide--D-alanyl-D-alanine ligase n=1 Tax=Asprobacillus argus TaxID=3076534 RepID=A0ABU3LIK0_9FLAO|nr:UDP-N-acetylmuramoyl-tripeptide--D-alanyl-D-alanine ligase [Flavobacteriaceae bacterium S356]
MKIEQLYNLYKKHYQVDTDTRKIRPNSIYFALKGKNFNGNAFAKEAIKKGASYCIVDEQEYANDENIILVEDVLTTLQELAKYHRNQFTFPVLALTGSNGKTTSKELINCVLSKKFKTGATFGNLNNHIGVPLTLLSFDASTEFGIVEMGANHLNEIAFLSNIAKPDFGYITNFGKAHLEGFGSVEGVIKGKSELYQFIGNNKKKVFVNPNDKKQLNLTKYLDTIFFDKTIVLKSATPFLTIAFENIEIQSNLIGDYNFDNIACAITIGNYFGVKTLDIKEAIASYVPTNNRSQIIETTQNKIILDAYNANPTSVEAALKSFSNLEDTHKVVVLGDMFELGQEAATEHQKIADMASSLDLDLLFFVGENFEKIKGNYVTFNTIEDLKDYLAALEISGAIILIKGSRGMALERLLTIIN